MRWLVLLLLMPGVACAQSSVSFLTQRVFVTGVTPVIGPNGGVGGVDVDADGVLKRVSVAADGDLAAARAAAMKGVADDVRRASAMRKVSLRKLESEIARQVLQENRKSLSPDVLFLAGLQRVEYVFIYPESKEIVIAGPAEGWTLRDGAVVGAGSGAAVLRLDDLLDALQGNAAAPEGTDGISCSIDPTADGMARVQRMLQSGNVRMSESVLRRMEELLGQQNVTVTGVRPGSHYARVLVGADYLMKRIAMGLDRSPVAAVPSYMEMLKRAPGRRQLTAPRWWIATDYATAEKSEDGLAWRFAGRGVKVMSEHGYLNARGELVTGGRASPLAQMWADKFSEGYEELSRHVPAFGQLRGCVDLAVMSALLTQETLTERAECPLAVLSDSSKLVGEEFAIPKVVPSQASAARGRSGWVVSVSGGVDVDTWNVLKRVEVNPKLGSVRQENASAGEQWWWD